MSSKILTVNNIEVVYNNVILVLKGISLEIQKNGIGMVALVGITVRRKTPKIITGLTKIQNCKIKDSIIIKLLGGNSGLILLVAGRKITRG